MYRRCQAYDALEQIETAYKDAREVHRLDPNNKAIQPYLTKLHKEFSEKVATAISLSGRVASVTRAPFSSI